MGVYFARTGIEFVQTISLKNTLARARDSSATISARNMGKHFTASELDLMHQLRSQGASAAAIQRRVAKQRGACGGPDLTSVLRALMGRTFKRAKVETPRAPGRYRTIIGQL